MGTTLATVQVYLGDRPREKARDAVIESLRRYVLQGTFTETTHDQDPDADRTVFIGQVKDSPWLTLFDTQGDLRVLARSLSEEHSGTTVYISLIDSDVIHLRLYRKGKLIDDYCNAPELYDLYSSDPDWQSDWGDLSEDQLKALTRGDNLKWRDLLVPGTDADKLRELWASKPILADEILWATVHALGMDEEEIGAILSFNGAQAFSRLTFRMSEPRQYEVKAEGLPKLFLSSYGLPTEVYVGDELDPGISVQNDGGPATGLDVLAWGSALDTGIIRLKQATIRKTTSMEAADEAMFVPREGQLGDQTVTMYLASFPEFELPQGIEGGWQVQTQPGVDWRKAFDALSLTQFHVRILGTVETTGTGDLFIAFAPHANRAEGYAAYQTSLQALSTPRQPLRYQNALRKTPTHWLQRLDRPTHLFAVAAMAADRPRSASIVADLISEWTTTVAKNTAAPFVARVQSRLDLMPDEQQITIGDISSSAYWEAMHQTLATCVSFSIQHGAASMLFDASTLFFQRTKEEPAPQLGIFYSVEALESGEAKLAEEWLEDSVDGLMARKEVLQAIVGHWDWGEFPRLEMTPYETACSVHRQCTTARFWCKRFLRGVTERVWLGPELIEELGGTDQLAPFAEVTEIGNGVRLRLKEPATLDDLERVLAPLLASEQDWQEGMARLYPRQ